MKHRVLFLLPFILLSIAVSVFANGGIPEDDPATSPDQSITPVGKADSPNISREEAIQLVKTEVLSSMLTYVIKKKWDLAWYHLSLYKSLSSDDYTDTIISDMLQKKNRDGAAAVIRLTKMRLINPAKSPIVSSRQVKLIFLQTLQVITKGKKWESKAAIMQTYLSIFSLEKMTRPESVAVSELLAAIDKELTVTATSLENVLIAILEDGNLNPTPLDLKNLPTQD